MRVRKMSPINLDRPDEGRDMTFGHGAADFFVDQPEAPAQACETRLQLFLGEYFLDRREGTPWRTRVLGKRTNDTRDPVVRSRILGTPGVTGLPSYNSRLDRDSRAFSAAATIDTAYGRTIFVAGLREPA